MIEDHGIDATFEISMMADDNFERGDLEGQRMWMAVLRRVEELQARPCGTMH